MGLLRGAPGVTLPGTAFEVANQSFHRQKFFPAGGLLKEAVHRLEWACCRGQQALQLLLRTAAQKGACQLIRMIAHHGLLEAVDDRGHQASRSWNGLCEASTHRVIGLAAFVVLQTGC